MPTDEMVGECPAMVVLRGCIRAAVDRSVGAGRPPLVVFVGETGTGKGLAALMLHRTGPRAGGPFHNIHLATLPDSLLEVELFGHAQGFADAPIGKPGLWELGHRGT